MSKTETMTSDNSPKQQTPNSLKLDSESKILIPSENGNGDNDCNKNGLSTNYCVNEDIIDTSSVKFKCDTNLLQNIDSSTCLNDLSRSNEHEIICSLQDKEHFSETNKNTECRPSNGFVTHSPYRCQSSEGTSQTMVPKSSISDDGASDLSTESVTSEGKESDNVENNDNTKNILLSEPYMQLEEYKIKIIELQDKIERLQNERAHLELQASHSVCQSKIDQMQREIDLFKQEHELDKRTQATLKLEIESLKKQYDTANKEREAIVMRYAVSEMEVINQRKELDNFDKKYKESIKEKEALSYKLKTTAIDKARIGQILDNKCSELGNTQKDVEKLKEELNSRDIKIKWTQNKLKSEIETRKESEAQVEKLSSKIQEAKEEVEKAKKDAELAIKQFQFSQENRAYVLEQQLKEQQAQVILERHNLEDKEQSNKLMLHEIESLRNKQLLLMDENNALKLTVASLEKERQEQSEAVSRLRESVSKSSEEVGRLHERTSTMDNLSLQLQQEQERVLALQKEVSQLKTANEDLANDMAGCREREAEMLEFTQKVTAKNVRLQSEFSCIEAKARQLECEEEPLQRKVNELMKSVEALQKELNKERSDRNEEKKLVARHLAEKTAKVENLTRELEDLKGENQVMKHKHATAIRELNREVALFRRRLEQPESSSGSDSLCQGSRASSCTSLTDSAPPSTATTLPPPRIQIEPDKQTMVDRILRLQKENVRLREKMDFLEEHSKQLVGELQKKTKILQNYILREESGTLTSNSMDCNKAELAKHGGIMASIYTTKAADDSMTLELSLKINQKLQAVLEDTLHKNITLKENLDTLGDEIERLIREKP